MNNAYLKRDHTGTIDSYQKLPLIWEFFYRFTELGRTIEVIPEEAK